MMIVGKIWMISIISHSLLSPFYENKHLLFYQLYNLEEMSYKIHLKRKDNRATKIE